MRPKCSISTSVMAKLGIPDMKEFRTKKIGMNMFQIKLLLKLQIWYFSNRTPLKNDINDLFKKLGIGNFVSFQLFKRHKSSWRHK